MRILFDHPNPFLLAHGGFQTQIEQTKFALEKIGVQVDWLRWWDDRQAGDLIHYFGRPSHAYIDFAHQKGLRVVLAELLTGLGSRGRFARNVQSLTIAKFKSVAFFDRMGWRAYELADAAVALTPWEAELMCTVFGAQRERIHVIPNGVEHEFLQRPDRPLERSDYIVCTATITPRKRVLELAKAAIQAGTPLWVLGKPYSESDPYYKEFRRLSDNYPELLKYEGEVTDRSTLAKIYREARGFVLLSTMESLSLSALEAAACECPLLLSDLPWARTSFGEYARYCSVTASGEEAARHLKAFVRTAPEQLIPPRPATWDDIAKQFQELYGRIIKCGG